MWTVLILQGIGFRACLGLVDVYTQTITNPLSNCRIYNIPNSNSFIYMDINISTNKVSLKTCDLNNLISILDIGYPECNGSINLDFTPMALSTGTTNIATTTSSLTNTNGGISCTHDTGIFNIVVPPYSTISSLTSQGSIMSSNNSCYMGTVSSSDYIQLLNYVVSYIICGNG